MLSFPKIYITESHIPVYNTLINNWLQSTKKILFQNNTVWVSVTMLRNVCFQDSFMSNLFNLLFHIIMILSLILKCVFFMISSYSVRVDTTLVFISNMIILRIINK